MGSTKNQHQALTSRITIRLNSEQLSRINAAFTTTTSRTRSIYLRSLLLRKPVTFYTRNKSLDELMVILRPLKNDLQNIVAQKNGNLQRLQMSADIPQQERLAVNDKGEDATMLTLVQAIYDLMEKMTKIWLQE